MGSLPCGLWSGDLVTLQMGSEPSHSGLEVGAALSHGGTRFACGGLPQPGGRPGELGPPGGTGRASSPPSTPGVALRHGRGLPLMGEQELEVKAGREERSSGIYRGRPLCA